MSSARLTIGVTGHRKLDDPAGISAQAHQVLEHIHHSAAPATTLCALSPLAEGADRIVASEVLRFPGAILEAALPLAKADYMKDFATSESRAEFESFLARANRVIELPPAPSRNDAYFNVGVYVVDHCDIIIAVWNGKPATGRGGTGEIVEYARQRHRPLCWIHTADAAAAPSFEPGDNPTQP
jgi:hypothetical protein